MTLAILVAEGVQGSDIDLIAAALKKEGASAKDIADSFIAAIANGPASSQTRLGEWMLQRLCLTPSATIESTFRI